MTPEQEQIAGELKVWEHKQRQRTTLYDIATEIAELIELQESAETEEERMATQLALEAYREKLPQKVDDVRGYIKHCEMMADGAWNEAKEQQARHKLWEARAQRTKDYALEVMLALKVKKKLSGRTGDLTIRANPPSVEITREDLLPVEFKKVTVSMRATFWEALTDFLNRFEAVVETLAPSLRANWNIENVNASSASDKAAIAAALKQPCRACRGTGETVCAISADQPFDRETCMDCNGTGKATVPGARLVTDRAHLRL